MNKQLPTFGRSCSHALTSISHKNKDSITVVTSLTDRARCVRLQTTGYLTMQNLDTPVPLTPQSSILTVCPWRRVKSRSQKIIPGRTNGQTFRLVRPASDGHLFNSTGRERTSRKIVLINSRTAGHQQTLGIINSEAGGQAEKRIFAGAGLESCGHK